MNTESSYEKKTALGELQAGIEKKERSKKKREADVPGVLTLLRTGPSTSNYGQSMHSIVRQASQGDDRGGVWGASPGSEEDVRLSTICLAERTVCDPFALPSSTSTRTPPGATKLHITAVAAALRELNKGQALAATNHQNQARDHTHLCRKLADVVRTPSYPRCKIYLISLLSPVLPVTNSVVNGPLPT